MKYRPSSRLALFLLLSLCLSACDSGSTGLPDPSPERGEPVNLSFDLFRDATTRADGSSTTTEQMSPDKMFRIYAYPAGSTDFGNPTGSENYTVQSDQTATGDLKLYRGTYDMYLVSYNSSTEVPELSADNNTIHVPNDRDFMYTKLANIVVQPDKTGEYMMKVALPSPFTRMGSQVITTVAARNGIQPVRPTKLVVNYVRINGLRSELEYKLNSTVWEKASASKPADASFTFSQFKDNGNLDVCLPRKSNPGVLLPVDGTQKLTFDVNLTVSYVENNAEKTMTDTYKASIEKSLLPGMTYQFDFSLTFYGVIIPTDLTLAIREWTTTDLKGEGLGED